MKKLYFIATVRKSEVVYDKFLKTVKLRVNQNLFVHFIEINLDEVLTEKPTTNRLNFLTKKANSYSLNYQIMPVNLLIILPEFENKLINSSLKNMLFIA